MKQCFFVLLAFLLGFSAPAEASRVQLGVVSLMDTKDKDVVNLPLCRNSANKTVTRLQVSVAKFAAQIDRLNVQYHNGQNQFLNVREKFQPGSTSRWIDLSGDARCIKKIIIIGDTDTRRRTNRLQAKVTFWGWHPDARSPKPVPMAAPKPLPKPVKVVNPPNQAPSMGVKLGQVRLTDAKDRDVIRLPACSTPANTKVNRVQLKIKKYPAEINRFKVVFYNGDMQVLEVKKQFKADSQSRWIDLKGNARCIKEFVIIGDTKSLGRRPGRQATVVVRGLHFTDNSPPIAKPTPKPSPVAPPNRIKLGVVSLMDDKDKDVVNLPVCRSSSNKPVTRLQVQVAKFDAEIDRLNVQFHNGENQNLNIREKFKAGTSSRWIDLSGNARCIKKIIILGDTDTRRHTNRLQSLITFWGLNGSTQAPAPAPKPKPSPVTQSERIKLGTVSLMDTKDKDVVNLPACRSSSNKPVTRLQVQVAAFDAEIDRLNVQFHNGENQNLSVREKFKAGSTSRWIDLSGNARCIKKIIILGDTDTRRRTNRLQSRITFWGLHPK